MTLRVAPAGTPPPTAADWAMDPTGALSGFTEIGYISDTGGIKFTNDDREDWFDGTVRTDTSGSFSIGPAKVTVYDAAWNAIRSWSNPYLPSEPPPPRLQPHTTFRLHDPCAWAQPGALTLAQIRRIRNTPITDLMRELLAYVDLTYKPRRSLP